MKCHQDMRGGSILMSPRDDPTAKVGSVDYSSALFAGDKPFALTPLSFLAARISDTKSSLVSPILLA